MISKEIEKAFEEISKKETKNPIISILLSINLEITQINVALRESFAIAKKNKDFSVYNELKELKKERLKRLDKIIQNYKGE